MAEADVLHETDVNDLQERQKFSGYGRRRRQRDRHQQGAAVARVPREAHRRGALPRFREHAQPGLQGTAAAEVEEGSDRADDGEPEPDPAADRDQGVEGDLRLRQGRNVRQSSDLVRIGTSGWNYPSGKGTWNGIFYPPSRGRPKGFDELAFYAEHFDTVEVNSTFYGQPRAEVRAAWAERTPPGFEFSVKLYQKFTHPRMFKRAAVGRAARRCRAASRAARRARAAERGRPRRVPARHRAAGVEPASWARCSRSFPPSFKDAPASRDYLAGLLRAFAGYPVAVELRHRAGATASARRWRC